MGRISALRSAALGVCFIFWIAMAASAAPGDLDPTFGSGGKVITTGFRPDPAASSAAYSVIIQPDGRIVTAGTSSELAGTGQRRFLIMARYNPDGSLDTSFGVGGRVTSEIAGPQVEVNDLAIQADGKLLVAGGSFVGGGNGINFFVARFLPNGDVDNSFGQAGIASADYSGGTTNDDIAYSVIVQPDQKIVAGGYARMGDFVDYALVRFNTNGTLDASFGSGGKTSTSLSGNTDVIRDVIRQDDGKLVAVGYVVTSANFDFAVVRYNADGSLDNSFGNAGRVITDFGAGRVDAAYSGVLQRDGKIVAGGSAQPGATGSSDFALARYLPNGTLDTTFGSNGLSTADLLGAADRIHSLVIQNNGKIVGAGYALVPNEQSLGDFGIARVNVNGSIDTTFGVNGRKTFNFAPSVEDRAFGLALQRDGKLVVAGFGATAPNTSSRMALARLIGDPAAARAAAFDYDGDRRADASVFRPSEGVWYSQNSSSGFTGLRFGVGTDKIVPADYDGDGKTDFAVFRDGDWYWLSSSNGQYGAIRFGQAGDVALPKDYTGDGRADLGIFRSGVWYIMDLANGAVRIVQFGSASDKAVAADYDGDGKADVAVYRGGVWYWLRSSDGGVGAVHFGIDTDRPVPADYDGDSLADPAVFRDGVWYVLGSTRGYYGLHFGSAGDRPVADDYDGDGAADFAVFRSGVWYLQQTTGGFTAFQFGTAGDRPTQEAFVP